MINYEKCAECGACIKKCQHGVYDKTSAIPLVIYPDGCIQGCKGCGKLCPMGAIEYFGNKSVSDNDNGCGCGSCGCSVK